ncbi:hypothetical protein OROHE_022934 [Orobanche hederae]
MPTKQKVICTKDGIPLLLSCSNFVGFLGKKIKLLV